MGKRLQFDSLSYRFQSVLAKIMEMAISWIVRLCVLKLFLNKFSMRSYVSRGVFPIQYVMGVLFVLLGRGSGRVMINDGIECLCSSFPKNTFSCIFFCWNWTLIRSSTSVLLLGFYRLRLHVHIFGEKGSWSLQFWIPICMCYKLYI